MEKWTKKKAEYWINALWGCELEEFYSEIRIIREICQRPLCRSLSLALSLSRIEPLIELAPGVRQKRERERKGSWTTVRTVNWINADMQIKETWRDETREREREIEWKKQPKYCNSFSMPYTVNCKWGTQKDKKKLIFCWSLATRFSVSYWNIKY